MLRSLSATGLVLALGACQPDLPHTPPNPSVVNAVFDPTTSQIPLPNDLAFLNPANSVCPGGKDLPAGAPPACAQAELLTAFGGKFPNDQEVAITVDFVQTNFTSDGATSVAPDLDFATFTEDTAFVSGKLESDTSGAAHMIEIEPIKAADYVKGETKGTLTIHNKGDAAWAPGSYSLVIRGGANGVKTADGTPIGPSQVFYLIAQGKDMTDPANIGLLKAQLGSTAAALEQGAQLNLLIALYKGTAFPAAMPKFPPEELAIAATFQIASKLTNVMINADTGDVPLPIDLLRDPRAPADGGGKLTAIAACTLAGSTLGTDGKCLSPAAAGFAALDGFSTTGPILGPTSDFIQAATVTGTSLMLFDLSNPTNPVQVPPTSLIIEPCEFTSSCAPTGRATAVAPVIAIQPAGASAGEPDSIFRTKPLKDNTTYAVVMTTDIKDKDNKAIGPGTVAKILRFKNPVVVNGHSALQGIDDATTAGLEKMRLELAPVFATLAAAGTDASKVAMAYTFKTQTILSQANQLAALPYSPALPAALALPIGPVNGDVRVLTVDQAFDKYGAKSDIGATPFPSANIKEILEVDINTLNALDPASGAFLADPTMAVPEQIHVLIATPEVTNPNVPQCTIPGLTALKCAPMMIFRHGIGRSRADMLAIADTNAAAGLVTVAIDAAKHGDRSFCTSGPASATTGCVGGAACVTALPPGAQGDVNPPGSCGDAGFVRIPLNSDCTSPGCRAAATAARPAVSGNFLVSANFFRTRDTMRQDLIDESQLVHTLAFAPTAGVAPANVVFNHMSGQGFIIDPTKIYYSGQSLGAIQGAMNVAANPRISKAVFNVGGGTLVDVFTNSPSFKPQVDPLLASLGIVRGTPEFLQFLVVAKTVLDPADPINFAGHITENTLPNLLTGGTMAQTPKKALTQIAYCDGTVPNAFNFLFASNVPTNPLPPTGLPGTGPNVFTMFVGPDFANASSPCGVNTAIGHSFLIDWVTTTVTQTAQTDMATFVTKDTLPPSLRKTN